MEQHTFLDSTQDFSSAFNSTPIPHLDQQFVRSNGCHDQKRGLEEDHSSGRNLNSGDAVFNRGYEENFKVPDVPPPKNNAAEEPYFRQSQENLNTSTSLGSQINMPSEGNRNPPEILHMSNQEILVDDWYESKAAMLAKASYLTNPTKNELFGEMTNEILQDYEKAKEKGDQQIIRIQELIQSNAARAIEEIASKWNEECTRREEEIRQKLEEIQQRMARNESLEAELSQFTAGMRDMYRLMQDQA